MQYLSGEDILVIHSEVVSATGGSHGVRDAELLAAIADKPRAAFGGNDLYPDLFTKAAVYLESIVNYHVFIDGNKRTGFVATMRFLAQNGYDFTAPNREVEDFVVSIAEKDPEIKTVATWLKKHSKRRVDGGEGE
jgi:death-on-curing protein